MIPRCLDCYPIKKSQSYGELELYNFIKSIYKGIILQRKRNIIKPLELDIYLPEHNLAFEYNGIYWHSEISSNTDKNYHLDKTEMCEKQNIQLIHIFEDEWLNKKDIIKNKIKHLLNLSDKKLYARKCIIKEIIPKIKNQFLNEYHIQSEDKSKYKLGLFHNNDLVGVMTFGKPRLSSGYKNTKEGTYELIRFATSIHIVGGFSKLLKHFIRNYKPIKIITYADRRYSQGNVYIKNGFKLINKGKPNYYYTKNHIQREHRFNYRKNVLNKKLDLYDKNLTEWQNMQINGYDRIWDCGSLKFELIIN